MTENWLDCLFLLLTSRAFDPSLVQDLLPSHVSVLHYLAVRVVHGRVQLRVSERDGGEGGGWDWRSAKGAIKKVLKRSQGSAREEKRSEPLVLHVTFANSGFRQSFRAKRSLHSTLTARSEPPLHAPRKRKERSEQFVTRNWRAGRSARFASEQRSEPAVRSQAERAQSR